MLLYGVTLGASGVRTDEAGKSEERYEEAHTVRVSGSAGRMSRLGNVNPLEAAMKLIKPTSIPSAFPHGIGWGTLTSHWRVSMAYQPLARLTIRACLTVASLGISRDWRNLTQPILGRLIIPFFNGDFPSCGNTKDFILPGFLNRGKRKFLSHIETKACSSRFRVCCKTCD